MSSNIDPISICHMAPTIKQAYLIIHIIAFHEKFNSLYEILERMKYLSRALSLQIFHGEPRRRSHVAFDAPKEDDKI